MSTVHGYYTNGVSYLVQTIRQIIIYKESQTVKKVSYKIIIIIIIKVA